MPVSLHTTDLGDRGSRIVFCHGLFGQGRNWTQVGKALAADHRVTWTTYAANGSTVVQTYCYDTATRTSC